MSLPPDPPATAHTEAFQYDEAFERNLGWLTEADQLTLSGKTVAIAGLGGVGGAHLLALARLGIGGFHIADLDEFALANFNRQVGASVHTIGRPKAAVMQEMALSINPTLRLRRFDRGVTADTVEAFLDGVDLYVDGLDFFAVDIRRLVFRRCHERGIPAVTAAPVGMGTSYLVFMPDGMSFERYFRLEGRPPLEQYLRFLLGVVPKALHRTYLVDPTRLNLEAKAAPSSSAGCQLAAGVIATLAVKLLLGRGPIRPAPWSQHYDAYRGMLASARLRFGLGGPLQRLKIRLALPAIRAMAARGAPQPVFNANDPIDHILHAARWTPSGDNEQPWRFERAGQETIIIHPTARTPDNPYHYRDNQPNVLAIGMLLESLRIAASRHRRRFDWTLESTDPLRVRGQFVLDETIQPDPLFAALPQRSVDRNRYRRRALTERERTALAGAIDGQLRLDWYTTLGQRWRFARLSARATAIRLRAPETFRVHQRIIDWRATLSPTRIPAAALGLRRSTLRIMRWALQSFSRTETLNRLGGTLSAAIEMDYGPILSSAGVFTLRFPAGGPTDTTAVLNAGRHIQRFWLTATRLGLAIQPAMAVLIFAHYGEQQGETGAGFTQDARARADGRHLAEGFAALFGEKTRPFVFMGRIGQPHRRMGISRSTRLPVPALMTAPSTDPKPSTTESSTRESGTRESGTAGSGDRNPA
ncbi:ThiF family adenylyltransferase [Rhodopila sp.]|uniref:ThiF family adenylyltransferase n=1 Tax=Rhodopila sp. TaxID=2480087 RepID=UPI002C176BF2|nr:ThiF family adenylyltransferase [Rhodopila sp.]HVZ09839.1 ThiF family adenylyltransferase [Rhodopila sp.]